MINPDLAGPYTMVTVSLVVLPVPAVRPAPMSGFVRDLVPVAHRLVAGVRLTGVRRAHHVDVPHAGIVGLDVALQFVQKCAMRLGRVGERLGPACFCHMKNYARALGFSQRSLMGCLASDSVNGRLRRSAPKCGIVEMRP